MVDMARANHIKVILCSTLPAENFSWRPNITDGMQKIRHLNERVKAYCKANKKHRRRTCGALCIGSD